jgi:hypothetical protein
MKQQLKITLIGSAMLMAIIYTARVGIDEAIKSLYSITNFILLTAVKSSGGLIHTPLIFVILLAIAAMAICLKEIMGKR